MASILNFGVEQIKATLRPAKRTQAERSERAGDRRKIKELEKELRRKDKALAEATALLVLKKKANLIWGTGDFRKKINVLVEIIESEVQMKSMSEALYQIIELKQKVCELSERNSHLKQRHSTRCYQF